MYASVQGLCVHVYACVCVCVCVCAQQRRAVLIILSAVCTPGIVGGQQGAFTVRLRPGPPSVIRFCGGCTRGRGQSETLSDLSSSRENGLDTQELDRHRKRHVRNLFSQILGDTPEARGRGVSSEIQVRNSE